MRCFSWILCMMYACIIYAEAINTESWALHLNCTAELIDEIAKKHGFHNLRRVTTNMRHACISDHSEMSSTAPLAAVAIPLALEANPTLTWRDVQHLMVRASKPADLQIKNWPFNVVGRPVSHYFGYELLDAERVVDLTSKWKAVKPKKKCTMYIITRAVTLSRKLKVKWNVTACHGDRNWIRSLEHIQAFLTLTCSGRGALSISHITPTIISNSLLKRPYAGFSDWAFISTLCWDPDPSGHQVIQRENNKYSTNRGVLLQFKRELHRTDERMISRRIKRSGAQKCVVRMSNGSCEYCVYPLYVLESICLTSCPPHYYESDGDSAHYHRSCLACHPNCQTCSGKQETDCLDCPPYSTLDSSLSTCSSPVYPWDYRVTVDMNRTALILCVLVGGALVVLFLLWVTAWIVNTVFFTCVAVRNQAGGSPGQGSNHEARDVDMVVFSVTEGQAENGEITSAFTNVPTT